MIYCFQWWYLPFANAAGEFRLDSPNRMLGLMVNLKRRIGCGWGITGEQAWTPFLQTGKVTSIISYHTSASGIQTNIALLRGYMGHRRAIFFRNSRARV